jgi:hypothetical protein
MPARKEPKIHAAAVLSPTIRVPPKRYLPPVVDAFHHCEAEVSRWVAWTCDPRNMRPDPKGAVIRFAAGIEQQAAALERSLMDAGIPDVAAGEQIATNLLHIACDLRDGFWFALQQAEGLDPTSRDAFGVGAEVLYITVAGARHKAFEAAEKALAVMAPNGDESEGQ